MLKTCVNTGLTKTIRAMMLPVQCRNRKNGCPEKGKEKEVEEHEIECEFRIVDTKVVGYGIRMFKDIFCSVDKGITGRHRKWKLCAERDDGMGYNKAYMDSIEPELPHIPHYSRCYTLFFPGSVCNSFRRRAFSTKIPG